VLTVYSDRRRPIVFRTGFVCEFVTQVRSSQVLSAAGIVALVGCVVSTVTPLVAGASPAFVGSIVTSGLLGVVFVGQSLRVSLAPSVPAATLTTVFGGWFVPAPLLYDVGFLATVGTQFGGLLVAAFGMYMLVAALAE
jgi:hypothetical protein